MTVSWISMDYLSLDHFLLHPWSCANYSPASVEIINLRPHLNVQGIHIWNFLEQLLLMIMVGGMIHFGTQLTEAMNKLHENSFCFNYALSDLRAELSCHLKIYGLA